MYSLGPFLKTMSNFKLSWTSLIPIKPVLFVEGLSTSPELLSTKKTGLSGISDPYDNLKFDLVFQNGPKEFISWFIKLANKRSNFKKNSWLFYFRITIYK